MQKRLEVGILGATGSVGQKLVRLLDEHPWFEIGAVAASERSVGRRYADAVHWLEPVSIPPAVADLEVVAATPPLDVDLVFSALGTAPARETEPAFARAGIPVVSNAGAYRMAERVPLLIPEVNPDHTALVRAQEHDASGRGFIVTNPNCSTTGLVCALKPLADAFGLETVHCTTLQAVSGAGYPGVASLDVLGNVVPFIRNEEEKLESEPQKILGQVAGDHVAPADFTVSATATRVPVIDGHLVSASLRLGRRAAVPEVIEALRSWRSPLVELGLPSAPDALVAVLDDEAAPQPRLHAGLGGGMTVSVGRVRTCPLGDVRLLALVHNTLRGAAGGALINAELLVQQGLVTAR